MVYSMKDDIRDLAANLYAIIICNQPDEGRVLEALDDFYSAVSDKVFLLTLQEILSRLILFKRR